MDDLLNDGDEKNPKSVLTGKLNENKDMMVEINIAEAPMFSFCRNKKNYLVKDLLDRKDITPQAKDVMNGIYKENENAKVDYRSWTDSKGLNRELIVASLRALPDSFCMDVFFGLVGLLIKNNSPITPDEKGLFDFKSNEIHFTLNKLCDEMNIKPGATTYERIKNALRKLKSVEYYSLGYGSIYNKIKEAYEVKAEKGISIITDYAISSRTKNEITGEVKFYEGSVIFGDLIMANLKLGFARVLRNHKYFQLKSGVGRGLYLYIEANRNSKDKYIKRSFEILRNKIPIEFDYPSRLKSKLKKPLEAMREQGIIKGYFYGDEYTINGVKEQCIYIIFKGDKYSLIKELENKYKTKNIDDIKKDSSDKQEEQNKLEFPSNIKAELLQLGINENKIIDLLNKHTQYELAKYILWIKDCISKGKVKDPAGLFVFAMTPSGESGNMVKVENSNPEIVKFIEQYREEKEAKKSLSEEKIKIEFNKYIEIELNNFLEEEEVVYNAMKYSILADINSLYEEKIKTLKTVYNYAKNAEEREKILSNIEKWESFPSEKENSIIFREEFIKRSKLYRGFSDYEEFKVKYMNAKIN